MPSTPSVRPPWRWRAFVAAWWQPASLLIATVIVYLPSLRAGFIMDDNAMLTDNPLIAAADGIRRFWYTAQPTNFFGPVTASSLWIEWRLWGLNPAGYHATNLALHCAEVLLLWGILRRLRVPGAWLAALLFAVHPLNVETVAWVTQRKNLAAMLFFLLSIRFFLQTGLASPPQATAPGSLAGGPSTRAGGRWYCLSLLAFVLAMLSKGSVAPLPLVLLGLIAWHRRPSLRDLLRLAPFFAAAVAVAAVDVWTQRVASLQVVRSAGFTERLLGAGAVVWFYLYKALWPAKLIFVYPQWRIVSTNVLWWLPLAAAVGLTVILWGERRRWSRSTLYAWGYFCAMLAPVLGFTDVYFMLYSLVADHYAHLALIGVVSWMAAMGTLAWQRAAPAARIRWRIPVASAAAAVILALGISTWRQCLLYRDALTLYQATVDANEDCWMAHNNLAVELAKIPGRMPDAIAHYERALRLKPDYAEAHNNLGIALDAVGRTQEAIAQVEEALRLGLDMEEVHTRLGTFYNKVGRLPEAVSEYEAAVRLKPDRAKGHLDLGLVLAAAGQGSRAISEYQIALQLDPHFAEAAFYLGVALEQANRTSDAIASYERALAIRPEYDVAHNNLAVALCKAGRVEEALPHYEEAIRINPAYLEAQLNLGFALSSLGRASDAISVLQRAADLAPANSAARSALGNALYEDKQIDRAMEQFAAVIRLDPRNADAHNHLGVCLASKGEIEKARSEFEAALEIRPSFAAAELNLSRCLQALGQAEAAETHRRNAERLQEGGGH
ncbi:MAG: tetratricopeptide repeat protein [Opitutaceae bacterium]|jgi:tetratricopeptide (TPR) repeat protein